MRDRQKEKTARYRAQAMMFMEGVGIGGCRVRFLINFAAVFIFCRMRAAVTLVFRYREEL